MAQYILHLGYDWSSRLIGSLWTTASSSYRPLQYALAGSDGETPAWFEFQQGDALNVQLWDLSSPQTVVPSEWQLNMSLASLSAGSAGSEDPSTYLSFGSSVSVQSKVVGALTNPYLDLGDINFSFGSYKSPWGTCRGQSTGVLGPLTFTQETSFELSFYLAVTAMTRDSDRITQVFVSDPEVIVGASGNPS
jgi:hypothetical protein